MNNRRSSIMVIFTVLSVVLAGCGSPPSTTPGGTTLPSAASTHATTPTISLVTVSSTYVHPEILVEAGWLYQHLDDPTVRIIDVQNPIFPMLYKSGHIPGAIHVDVFSQLCCPSKIMSADAFAKLMGSVGISDDTTVVVYDTDRSLWAARLWWALKYYGHEHVAILNGGLRQWIFNGYSLDTEIPDVQPAVFHSTVQPGWIATIEEVRTAIENPNVAILDALPWSSYTGDSVYYDRPGHITSALSFPSDTAFSELFQTVLPAPDLAKMLMRLKLDPSQRAITYCGGGHAGSRLAFILYLMGFENVALYDGSLQEWSANSSNPMEIVP